MAIAHDLSTQQQTLQRLLDCRNVDAELRGDLVCGPMSVDRPQEVKDGAHRFVARISRNTHGSPGYAGKPLAPAADVHDADQRLSNSPACAPAFPDQRARYCFMRSFFTVLPELM